MGDCVFDVFLRYLIITLLKMFYCNILRQIRK